MDGRVLTTTLGVLFVVGACAGAPAPSKSIERPLPTPSGSVTAAPATAAGSLPFSGRIAFDNHDDVWTINADGTNLIRLTESPGRLLLLADVNQAVEERAGSDDHGSRIQHRRIVHDKPDDPPRLHQ